MLRDTRIQMLVVLLVGATLGYAAASGKLNPFDRAEAAPPQGAASTETTAKSETCELSCCSEGTGKGQLLAYADPKARLTAAKAQANGKKPNILFIMGDDVGWFNIGAYHRGMMSGKTPNLDKLASQGMRFTDYYAEASCTAGRANLITGQLPIRTGLTTVGQAGADVGLPDEAVTLATALKSLGYETGQFGKNYLGDLNKYLPTVHGFDEFFGYLYHLDAMSDPYWFDYPQDWIDKYGPRNLVHSWATDADDPTIEPRWGKVGKQKIVDEGPLAPIPQYGRAPELAGRPQGQVRHGDVRRGAGQGVERLHGQGEEGRQAVLPLAQPDAHARLHLHPAEVLGADDLSQQLRPGRSGHGPVGR